MQCNILTPEVYGDNFPWNFDYSEFSKSMISSKLLEMIIENSDYED